MKKSYRMIDERGVWQTVTEEAESIIQREYGGNWQNKSLRVPRNEDGIPTAGTTSADGGEPFWDDLSTLADVDYRDLISALYDNLPDEPSTSSSTADDDDGGPLRPIAPRIGNGRVTTSEDELTVDTNFLHAHILPNSRSAGDLFDYIVFGHTSPPDGIDRTNLRNGRDDSKPEASTSETTVAAVEPMDKTHTVAEVPAASETTSYRCTVCEYATRSRTQFWRHRKAFDHFATVAPAEAPTVRCKLCDYETRSKFNLKRHVERIHVDERRFECDECAALFKDADALRRHRAYRHAAAALAVPHECTQCARRFTTAADARRHARLVHDGERAHACGRCARRFQTRANARRHFEAGVCAAK